MFTNLQGDTRFFITGHTGFKGAWLVLLLKQFGFSVYGYSLESPKFFLSESIGVTSISNSFFGDIRDRTSLDSVLSQAQPNVVIHLAAQPLVLESYRQPGLTFEVNVQGTANLLEIASKLPSVQTILVITTDKVYRNVNDGRRFTERDCLAGSDPYSYSKVAAEAVAGAWQKVNQSGVNPKVLVARAGNVIGGGDMSKDRLIPDIIKGAQGKSQLLVRNSTATRPWQHVLDPLLGYLLYVDKSLMANVPNALNFGPSEPSKSVQEVLQISRQFFDICETHTEDETYFESTNLDLDSSLATSSISWTPRWNQSESIQRTFAWWQSVLEGRNDAMSACQSDIQAFLS